MKLTKVWSSLWIPSPVLLFSKELQRISAISGMYLLILSTEMPRSLWIAVIRQSTRLTKAGWYWHKLCVSQTLSIKQGLPFPWARVGPQTEAVLQEDVVGIIGVGPPCIHFPFLFALQVPLPGPPFSHCIRSHGTIMEVLLPLPPLPSWREGIWPKSKQFFTPFLEYGSWAEE